MRSKSSLNFGQRIEKMNMQTRDFASIGGIGLGLNHIKQAHTFTMSKKG